MRYFIAAIFGMGVIRFALAISGPPNHVTAYASMTAIILLGVAWFAWTTHTHRERLRASFLLILPYMTVETLALGYTWVSGTPTIFHTPEHSFGTTIGVHTIGHLVGGLTWEPLLTFATMEALWGIRVLVRRTRRRVRSEAGS